MPTLTKQLADRITEVAKEQLQTSTQFKQPRMEVIKQNEDYAMGIVTPDLDIPFNDCYPVMSGYVTDMMAKIDDPPQLSFTPHGKADFLLSEKIGSAFDREVKSKKPSAKWRLKDRWGKKNALLSGRAIFKYWSASPGGVFQSNLKVTGHYDFHSEPRGGGDLGAHLWMGEEAIFKTREDILLGVKNGIYDKEQVDQLINGNDEDGYKDNRDQYNNRNNRSEALGLDVETHNYTGQQLFKFAEWYLTFRGIRWYCLFDQASGIWIRVKALNEIITTNEFPYASWSTNEDASLFWNLGPCDPVRILAKSTNRFLNQETYNREKQNKGQKAYDAGMFLDTEALGDPAIDSLIPVKVDPGKTVAGGIHEFTVPGLGGTINLVNFLDQFIGKNTGAKPGGTSDANKKVGVFYGELEQANEFIGTKNKSYTECQEELGMKFAQGLYQNLDNRGIEIQLMGPSGIEWNRLTGFELRKRGSLDMDISCSGGSEEEQLNEVERQRKIQALSALATVNPQWRDREIMKQSGFTDEEIKEAFSPDTASSKKLIAQADEAIEDIEQGRKPRMNRGANTNFMQRIIDYAESVDISDKMFNALFDYAMSHKFIVAKNTVREAHQAVMQLNAQARRASFDQLNNNQQGEAGGGSPTPSRIPGGEGGGGPITPEGEAISIGQKASNELRR